MTEGPPVCPSEHSTSAFIVHVNYDAIFLLTLQKDASGVKLKDLAIEMDITPSAVTYLKNIVPQKS